MDDEVVHPVFQAWLTAQRRAGLMAPPSGPATDQADEPQPERLLTIGTGELGERIHLDPDSASAGRRRRQDGSRLLPDRRPSSCGSRATASSPSRSAPCRSPSAGGRIDIVLPVRCDQTGPAEVIVTFAVGQEGQPAGMYASTLRRPIGPKLIIDTWGEALVAFAWQILLTLTSQLAGAAGKDARGNVLVPADLMANADGLFVQPMGRFRFSGASGLKATS